MTNYAGPLYEMNFVVTDEVVANVDRWIEETIRTALQQDSIEFARVLEPGTGPYPEQGGHTVRTCQFQACDDHSLDELLDEYFPDIEAEAAENFGDLVSIESRTLRADHANALPPGESPTCLNCGARLRGQYCGNCGQRSRNRLISIWQLLQEAFGDLFELDSRLWRTLVPLLTRPGQLTRDYLEGRRARYMPPFRTYMVLSIIFFVVAFFDPQDNLGLFFEPEPESAAERVVSDEATGTDEEVNEDKELNVVVGPFGAENEIFGNCENASIASEEDLPEWIKKRFPDDRVQIICERNKARGNEDIGDAMLDNIPIALIVLLPFMALVLKALYPLSRRYFVEHLLFFVYFHSFVFLMLILQILFARLAALFGPEDSAVDGISTLIIVVASFYIPVYLYKAMRFVYRQGHLITILKFLMLSIAYLTGATLTMFGTFLFAVLSA